MEEQASKEMGRRQRELVDNCFEESLYELAIALLDELTSPTVWPSPHHIRQILYLSLYPVEPLIKEAQKAKKPSGNVLTPPSPEAVSAALDLLNSFLITLPPCVILKALPSYNSRIDHQSGLSGDYALASAATSICSAQNCWELLKPGFLQPSKVRQAKKISSASSAPVTENTWPVLEWLVAVFERETYSLLSQIPSTTSGPRFAIEVIMDIIFLAFADPSNHRRTAIGERLLYMLINLTRLPVPLVSPNQLVRETSSRLHDLSTSGPLAAFLSSLRQLDFKLAVCTLYLNHYSRNDRNDSSQGFPGGTHSTMRVSDGPTISGFTSKITGDPQDARPYQPPQTNRLEAALLLPPDIEEGVEPQSPTQVSSPFSPLSPVRLRPSQVAEAALKHAITKLGLIGAASGLGIKISWDGKAFAASASVLGNQLFQVEDEVAAARAGIEDAESAAVCIQRMVKA